MTQKDKAEQKVKLKPIPDNVTKALEGKTPDQLFAIAKANKLDEDVGSPESRHPGQYRMVIGNKLRGILRCGVPVKIGRQSVTSLY